MSSASLLFRWCSIWYAGLSCKRRRVFLYRIRQDDFPAGFFYVKFWEIGESIDRNQWGCEFSDGVFDFIAHGVIFLKKCVKLYGNTIPFDKLGIKETLI